MNKKNIFHFVYLLSFNIATEPKISIQNIQNSINTFFCRGKYDKTEQKEFKNITTLELLCEQGNIFIHTWKQPSIIIEVKKNGTTSQHNDTKVSFKSDDNILQVQTIHDNKKTSATTHFNIIVAEDTKVKIATKHGNIYIKNLSACVHAQTEHGNIDIIDSTNNCNIQTQHGNITIQRETMQKEANIKAQSEYGNITLQVPQHINSKLQARSKLGKIYSDIFITLDPHTIKLTDETYKQQKHSILGTISKEPDTKIIGAIELSTHFGSIKIKPYI